MHVRKLGPAGMAALALMAGGMAACQSTSPPPTPPPQPVTFSPAQGQTPEQQSADQYDCETAAAARTGYHPSQPPPSTAPTEPVAGQRLAGAARGATAGAIREETTDERERELEDPSESLARAGAVSGGVQQRQARRENRQATQQQQANLQQQQQAFMQEVGSCMQSRGYTVQ
jgi:hypothetical protein